MDGLWKITPTMHTTPCNTKHDQFTTICLNPSFFVAIPLSGLGNFPWQPRIHAIRRAGSSILGSAAIRSRIQSRIIPTISCSVKRAIGTVRTTTLWPAAIATLRIHSARAIGRVRTTTLWPAAVTLTPLRIRTAHAIGTVRTTTLRPAANSTLFRIHSARAIGAVRTNDFEACCSNFDTPSDRNCPCNRNSPNYDFEACCNSDDPLSDPLPVQSGQSELRPLWPAAVTLTPLGMRSARAIGTVGTTTRCRPWPAAIRISSARAMGEVKTTTLWPAAVTSTLRIRAANRNRIRAKMILIHAAQILILLAAEILAAENLAAVILAAVILADPIVPHTPIVLSQISMTQAHASSISPCASVTSICRPTTSCSVAKATARATSPAKALAVTAVTAVTPVRTARRTPVPGAPRGPRSSVSSTPRWPGPTAQTLDARDKPHSPGVVLCREFHSSWCECVSQYRLKCLILIYIVDPLFMSSQFASCCFLVSNNYMIWYVLQYMGALALVQLGTADCCAS